MKNRKMITFVLACSLALSLAACSGKTAEPAAASEAESEESSEAESESSDDAESEASAAAASVDGGSASELFADLYSQGFNLGCISYSDGVMTANFINDDHTDFRQAVCSMTLKQCGELLALDRSAEDYDQQFMDILTAVDDLKIITPDLPDASAYESYVGKTIEEMEDDGFDLADMNEDEDGNTVVDLYGYTDDDATYTVRVYPEEVEDGKVYDDDEVGSLVAGKIIFWEFD